MKILQQNIFRLLATFILSGFILTGNAQNIKQKGDFTLGENTFLLNGKPFIIRAGEIHFPRIPREYWEHRIKMCKAMGMNSICIYLFWNFHEQTPGKFDFKGQKDVAEFIRLVQKNGMYAIVRPGPYACAEWDMGGLPWWLLKKPDLQVRTHRDTYFMESAKRYLKEVGKLLAPLQIQNGGNIILVQVENEYGAFGRDSEYMAQVRGALLEAGFDKVQLFRCDWSSTFNSYNVDNVAITLNFGAGSNVDNQFRKFKEMYPKAPLMCSEYWTGWFDNWGRKHETRSVESFIGSLKDMMDRKISCSLYMAHGGTSFGQWGGANCPPYSSMVASYDYNAPINEAGQPTDKFYAVRNLLKNYLNEGEVLADIPPTYPVITIPAITFTESAPLFDNLPKANYSDSIRPMEMFNQGWGRIVYRTKLPAYHAESRLVINEVHDWAVVYINGKAIGKLDRRRNENELKLPEFKQGDQLDILVEAMGRVNFDEAIIDRKGITKNVSIVSDNSEKTLTGWSVFNISVDYPMEKKLKYTTRTSAGPAWYRSSFRLNKTGDTYFDMSTWGKGMVWINDHNLGRYWSLGPQQTLFVPGCWLKNGENQVVVLDLEGPKRPVLSGIDKPILDVIQIDESLIHRKAGQQLDLTTETAAYSGILTEGADWKTVKFPVLAKGRYLCIEALTSQKPNDKATSLAELEVLDESGNQISRANWKLLYADSEEVTAQNNAADKVFDKQESTFWHTAWSQGPATNQPHQIVIDLGKEITVSGCKLLPRGDKNTTGMIKDFRVYLKNAQFKY